MVPYVSKICQVLLIIHKLCQNQKISTKKAKVPKCYLWSVILNSSQAPRTSTGSFKCLSSRSTQCYQLLVTSEFCCMKSTILSSLIPCRTLLMFIVLLTLKARLGGLLVRFSDGLCWPPNRMLCISNFNVV